jgi:predicted nucleic acid-binding protein
MELASASLFRAKWSEDIHEEWTSALLKDRPDLTKDQLRRTCDLMNAAVPDSIITGYHCLIDGLTLPDPKDRHVLAAAIHAGADAIVTFNLRDFPPTVMQQFNLEVLHPDDFIQFQYDFSNADVIIAARRCRERLKNPPKNVAEYLDTLAQQRLPKTVLLLAPYSTVI